MPQQALPCADTGFVQLGPFTAVGSEEFSRGLVPCPPVLFVPIFFLHFRGRQRRLRLWTVVDGGLSSALSPAATRREGSAGFVGLVFSTAGILAVTCLIPIYIEAGEVANILGELIRRSYTYLYIGRRVWAVLPMALEEVEESCVLRLHTYSTKTYEQ